MSTQYKTVPLKIAAVYAVIGGAWILFSDHAVSLFTSDPATITKISVGKGWAYVLFTALLLFWLIKRHMADIVISAERLRASEDKFSKAFTHSPVLMTISDIEDGRYIDVNDKFCQVSGFSRSEAVGRTSVEMGWIDATDRERLLSALHGNGRIVNLELELTARDGRKVYCLLSAELVDIEGEQRLLTIALDITDRKKDLEALAYANENFNQALNGSQHVLYRLNVSKGCYDYISPAFEEISGYPVAEFRMNGLEQLREYLHPDDRDQVFRKIEDAIRARTGKTVGLELEYRLRKADGSYFWFHDSTTACFDDTGALTSFFGSAHDITDRQATEQMLRASEERYRRFSSMTSDYVASCHSIGDEPFRILWMGGAVEKITGYSEEQILEWGCWLPLVHPDDVRWLNPCLQNMKIGDMREDEFRIVRRDGAVRWIHEISCCEAGSLPDERIRFGTSQDVTGRKEAETAIKNMNEHLERLVAERTADLARSNEELAGFNYAVSHELRAPIVRLKGFCDILGEVCTDNEEIRSIAERINNASRQLQSVVDSLLTLSRLSLAERNLQEVNLSGMVWRSVEQFREGHRERPVELVISPGITAVADPELMQICLDNLLGNAFKYTGRTDKPRIEFGSFSDSGKNVYFVRDNGAGFDMAYAEKLYIPFQRLHHPREFPGIGIGLATVKRIIEKHGGEIWAESVVGEGATFYFTLDGKP